MEKQEKKLPDTPSADGIGGQPEDAFDMINKYGTYEIQPTADSDNAFPAIAQGQPHVPKQDDTLVKDK